MQGLRNLAQPNVKDLDQTHLVTLETEKEIEHRRAQTFNIMSPVNNLHDF